MVGIHPACSSRRFFRGDEGSTCFDSTLCPTLFANFPLPLCAFSEHLVVGRNHDHETDGKEGRKHNGEHHLLQHFFALFFIC